MDQIQSIGDLCTRPWMEFASSIGFRSFLLDDATALVIEIMLAVGCTNL